MQRPKNIEDYSQCVRLDKKASVLWIFCVECNDWHQAAMLGECTMLFTQYLGQSTINAEGLNYICGKCEQDIGYMLDNDHKRWLSRKILGA